MNIKHLFFVTIVSSLQALNDYGNPGGELKSGKVGSETLDQMSLFCQQFNISFFNCSCEKSPDVCLAINFVETVRSNGTNTKTFRRWHGLSIIYATIAIISSVFGLIGNSVVIIVAFQQRGQLSPCKLHIAELAVVNFIFSASQVVNVLPLYWTNSWIYGSVMCTTVKTILEMGSLLSSGFFQGITVERYYLIVHAANVAKVKRFGERFKHLMLAGNLFLVTVTVIPYANGLGIEPRTQRCVNFDGKLELIGMTYNLFVVTVYSVVPIFVASVLAIKLIIHFAAEVSRDMMVSCEDVNKKLVKNMLFVFTMFIFCTLPSHLVTISIDVANYKSQNLLLGFQFLSYTLYSLQGTLNPILYSMMAKEWRSSLSKMLRKLFGANPTMLAVEVSLREDLSPDE